MPLLGTFETMPIAELLQWIGIGRKTGTLQITTDNGTAILAFDEGELIFSASSDHGPTLSELLMASGQLSDELQKLHEQHYPGLKDQRLRSVYQNFNDVNEYLEIAWKHQNWQNTQALLGSAKQYLNSLVGRTSDWYGAFLDVLKQEAQIAQAMKKAGIEGVDPSEAVTRYQRFVLSFFDTSK